jgi:hypothetical protein
MPTPEKNAHEISYKRLSAGVFCALALLQTGNRFLDSKEWNERPVRNSSLICAYGFAAWRLAKAFNQAHRTAQITPVTDAARYRTSATTYWNMIPLMGTTTYDMITSAEPAHPAYIFVGAATTAGLLVMSQRANKKAKALEAPQS